MTADHNTLTAMVRQSLAQGQPIWLTVTSGSMRPLLHEGDQVEVVSVAPETLTSGDIVVFDDGRSLLTHRLRDTKLHNGRIHLRTRGDRLIHYDPPFTADTLIGRVTGRKRGNHLLDFATNGQILHHRLTQLATLEERWLGRFGSLTSPPATFFQRVVHFKFKIIGRIITLIHENDN